jgi:hypothetical protein
MRKLAERPLLNRQLWMEVCTKLVMIWSKSNFATSKNLCQKYYFPTLQLGYEGIQVSK